MDTLKIGDYVKVGNGDYSRIYGFAHHDDETVAKYLQIYTEDFNETPLEISEDHMVFK
jgi:hypothetical protein